MPHISFTLSFAIIGCSTFRVHTYILTPLAAVGSRPAYRLAVSYTGADGKAAAVQNFGAGRVAVGLSYRPAATEQAGSLYLVYSGDKNDVEWLSRSGYKVNSSEREGEDAPGRGGGGGNVIASAAHLGLCGVGYLPAPAFTDTANHWAKSDIDFAVSRGLLAGTSDTAFTPDGVITRGMFVTALGRLAGIDPAGYPSSGRFSDVPAAACYAPYAEWAASKGIVDGAGEKTFSPDAAVTREQMAVFMRRYADKMGYPLPVVRAAENFADEGQITGGMKDAVRAMQQAGVMNGKDKKRFDPQGNATRAEGSAMLRRFVEIVTDPATATGWVKNDSGHWLYYKGGKALTGWRTIGGLRCYFNDDGVMAVNTSVDGCEIGPDGAPR